MCHRSGTSEPEAGCCEEPAEGCAPQKMSQGDTMTQGVSLGGIEGKGQEFRGGGAQMMDLLYRVTSAVHHRGPP